MVPQLQGKFELLDAKGILLSRNMAGSTLKLTWMHLTATPIATFSIDSFVTLPNGTCFVKNNIGKKSCWGIVGELCGVPKLKLVARQNENTSSSTCSRTWDSWPALFCICICRLDTLHEFSEKPDDLRLLKSLETNFIWFMYLFYIGLTEIDRFSHVTAFVSMCQSFVS